MAMRLSLRLLYECIFTQKQADERATVDMSANQIHIYFNDPFTLQTLTPHANNKRVKPLCWGDCHFALYATLRFNHTEGERQMPCM